MNGTGLEYPVAEGTGKWIEFHNDFRDGASSVGNDLGDAIDAHALGVDTTSAHSNANAFDNDRDAVRSRRNGRESDEEGMTMV